MPTFCATIRSAFVLALLMVLSGQVMGWGQDGHRIVGRLAQAELSPAAKTEVDRLLADESDRSLEGVSTWADEIRDTPDGRRSSRWHWVNLSKDPPCTYVPERDCADGNCVIGAINSQLAILADRQRPLAERRDALKFVVHFVGDAHQPFHAGFADDRGGNTTQLQFDRRGWNLHALWDSAMVTQAGLSPADYASQLGNAPSLPADAAVYAPDQAAAWALESCRAIGDNTLYPSGRFVGRGYLEQHRPLVEQRLRQAGERLAAALNDALAAQ